MLHIVQHTRCLWKFSLADIKKIFFWSDLLSKISSCAAWNIFLINSLNWHLPFITWPRVDFLLTPSPPLLVHVVIEWPLNGRCFSVLLQFSSNSRIENVSGQDNHVTWKIGNDSPEKFMAFIRRAYIALQLRVSHKWRQYFLKFGLFEKGVEF